MIMPLNQTEERILRYIDKNRDELYRRISELVQIDTVNHRSYGNENQGQEYLERICREIGLETDRFTPEAIPSITEHKDYISGRGGDVRENLVAILRGEGRGRAMLAAHMDTVDVGDLSRWTDDPFSGIIRDGRIYGRGSGDDKSGIVVAWFILKMLRDLGITPKSDLLLGSYCDEEGGGGNGALALALKYPCELCINLDSRGFETVASGGGCFRLRLKSERNDSNVASVFDVFEGVRLVVEGLAELNSRPNTRIRLSSAQAGQGGEKEGTVSIGVYTDMTKEECQAELDGICDGLKTELDRLGLITDGFLPVTRYFIYGETDKSSKEAGILKELIREDTGCEPATFSNCLSDLSLLLAYGSKNSFNYGIEVGSAEGGNTHQPNEHVYCDKLLSYTARLAILIYRTHC